MISFDLQTNLERLIQSYINAMWTIIPAQVVSYNETERTISAQPVIQSFVSNLELDLSLKNLPVLEDIPVIYQSAGGFEITFPIKVGDDVLLLFSKQCIDNWWATGDVQPPAMLRSFDISDGFAILRPFNQTYIKGLPVPSTENLVIRTEDDLCRIQITPTKSIIINNEQVSIVIDNTGNIIINNQADFGLTTNQNYNINIIGNNTISVGGDSTITNTGKVNLQVTGDVSVQSDGDIEIKNSANTIKVGSSSVTINDNLEILS